MSFREDRQEIFEDETELSRYAILTDSRHIFQRFEQELDNVVREEGSLYANAVQGEYINMKVSVINYPPGASNTVLVFDEMLRKGVRVAVKIGYGVYLRPTRHPLRIALAAVRLEGLLNHVYPPEIPSVASITLVNHLSRALENRDVPHDIDLVASVGMPLRNLENGFLPNSVRKWDINVIDTDTSIFYLMAYQRKAMASSVIIPIMSAAEAEEYGIWSEHEISKKMEDLFNRIAPSVLEGLWQVKESAERGMQLEFTKHHRHENKH